LEFGATGSAPEMTSLILFSPFGTMVIVNPLVLYEAYFRLTTPMVLGR
jgi:hypothetical protein